MFQVLWIYFMLELCDMQIILEGMGRSLHTNYNAQFKCDALKVDSFIMFYPKSRNFVETTIVVCLTD